MGKRPFEGSKKEKHDVRQVEEIPWCGLTDFKPVENDEEDQTRVVERKDPEKAASVKLPQGMSHRCLPRVDRIAKIQEDSGDEESADDEKQLHPNNSET